MPFLGVPRKVIDKALEMGADEKCINAGPLIATNHRHDGTDCGQIMMEAYDFFYGGVPPNELAERIAADCRAELELN